MTSKIEIANLALGNIREKSINAFTESSIQAQVCSQRYDIELRFLLRDFPWNFAYKTASLALYDETPREWIYSYAYPNDCLNARYIPNETSLDRTVYYREELEIVRGRIQFEVAISPLGKAIYTDQPGAYLAYTYLEEDPNKYDHTFIEAFSWYLAASIAVPIVGAATGRALRQDALQVYNSIISAAKADNGNEAYRGSQRESPTITARR